MLTDLQIDKNVKISTKIHYYYHLCTLANNYGFALKRSKIYKPITHLNKQ